ncbi:MAG TPA: efflux transporter outer membrane subunit [Thermoanaerobaculia bacterium]|nr:efflux transporter outer membrane subunit [Thermoanaerobaculia bacterium]
MRRAALLAAALLLAGCTMGPDYVRPKVAAPPAWEYGEKEAQATVNAAWWKQFGDPVLDGLIAEALANNRNLLIAAARVEQAAAVLTETAAPLYPSAGYGASAGRARASESGATPVPDLVQNPQSSYQTLASASWEIDLWGRVRRLTEAAQANLFASEEARRGVILSLVGTVASTYVQLLGLDEQLAVAKRNLATYAESVRLFELKFAHGQVSQMNVEQARTQYETAAVAIPQIALQIVRAENSLSTLLGRNPGPVARGKTIDTLVLPAVPAGIPSEILANRPDVRQAEQELVAANAQIGAAKALYFPSISLTGAFGSASADLSNLFKGPAVTWSWTASLTGPLFQGGAIRAQVKQAEAGTKAALLAYEASIQSAFSDVENALASHRFLSEQVEAQRRLVKAGSEYERLARLQYDGGYAPYSTVLQAEQQLFPSELNYASYRAQLFGSLVDIYKAMGGGWVTLADEESPKRE